MENRDPDTTEVKRFNTETTDANRPDVTNKRMMNLIKKAGLALFLILLLPAILLAVHLSIKPCYGETYYAELPEMVDRLDSATGKKLIILGNSDVAFGLNGQDLQKQLADNGLSYTICPFGLYAAVGTSAMLELSKKALGDGDVVVIVVEPSAETLSCYFGANAFLKCAESSPKLLSRVNNEQKKALVGNAVSYLQDRYEIKKSGILPSTGNVYQKAAFDEYCDMTYDRPGNTMQLGFDSTEPIDLAAVTVYEDFRKKIAEYCEYAAGKGATVYVSFSPVNRSALTDGSQEAVKKYFTTINEAFPCTVISDPNDYIMDSCWFYDSNLHLNNSGAVLRTAQFAEDIMCALGCYTAQAMPEVERPDSIYTATETEGDEDAFIFQETEDGTLQVIGLTSEGMLAKSLKIPSSVNSKVVTSLHAGAFTEGPLISTVSVTAVVEELTIPESIASLPDYLFVSTPNLKRLILLHEKKPPTPSEHTFDGLEGLKIFVPETAYSLYRDGAGCEVNRWEQFIKLIYTY